VKKLIAIVASIFDVAILAANDHAGHFGSFSFWAALISLAAFLLFIFSRRRRP
jgi:hypothetical protein